MDNDPMIKLRSMIADLSLYDRFIGYPMNRPDPVVHIMLIAETILLQLYQFYISRLPNTDGP